MSGKDVLRERVARALWDEEIDRCGVTGKRRDIAREVAPPEFYDDADAVIAALGPAEERDANVIAFRYDDRAHHWETRRRYVTPWERIEDDT